MWVVAVEELLCSTDHRLQRLRSRPGASICVQVDGTFAQLTQVHLETIFVQRPQFLFLRGKHLIQANDSKYWLWGRWSKPRKLFLLATKQKSNQRLYFRKRSKKPTKLRLVVSADLGGLTTTSGQTGFCLRKDIQFLHCPNHQEGKG